MTPSSNDPIHSPINPQPRRLFLAIILPPELISGIEDVSIRLQKGARFTALQASWVPPANFHMTLHFLGPVEADRIAQLQDALRNLQGTFQPFQLTFNGLGYFPHPNAPRVLWLGVPKPPQHLTQLVQATAEAIRTAGIELKHDNFHPHITLARFKSLKGTAAFVSMAKSYTNTSPGACEVSRIVLMESLFTKGAPEYREVAEFPFEAPSRETI